MNEVKKEPKKIISLEQTMINYMASIILVRVVYRKGFEDGRQQ